MNFLQKQEEYNRINEGINRDASVQLQAWGAEQYYAKMTEPWSVEHPDVLMRAKAICVEKYIKPLLSEGALADPRLIEVGCGMGDMCYRFESLGCDVAGVDKCRHKIGFCRKLEALYPSKRVRFFEMDSRRMPFASDWFDIGFNSMVAEHFVSPLNGLREIARVAQHIVGIIHMGKCAEDNPMHTRYLNKDSVKHLFEAVFESYQIEYVEDVVFAVYHGTGKYQSSQVPDYLFELLNLKIGERWKTTHHACRNVAVEDIEYHFTPADSFQESVVADYASALETHGKAAVENSFYPIQLVYNSLTGKYHQCGDGNHRLYALKQQNKIKNVHCSVTTIEKEA